MRRAAWLWLGLVLVAALSSMCGSSRPSSYSGGYREGYNTVRAGATYQAGGVAAGWDTVTLFLATKPDTTHFDGRFAQDRAQAGAAGKLRLGVNTLFRYDVIAQDDTSESFHTYTTWKNRADAPASGSVLDPRVGQAGRYGMLLYVNWEDIIPANSQIVSAELKGVCIAGCDIASYDRSDSVATVLMSVAADSAWMVPVAGKTIINGLTHHGFANWNWQIWGADMGANPARGHPAVSRKKWNPALIDRVHPWQFGEWASYTSTTKGATGGADVVAADSLVTIDITNPVQGAVNGEINNGIFIYIQGNAAGAQMRWWLNGWQGTGNLAKIPWIKVKYLTKRYKSEFPNNARSAFIFSTDDQVQEYNSAVTDSFKKYGGAYTIYCRADDIGTSYPAGQTEFAPYDSLVAWRADGMEIGSHSRFHWATWPSGTAFGGGVSSKWYGLNAYQTAQWGDIGTYTPRCGLAACTTGYDSLLYDSEPYWLYDGLGVDASDPYVGKSLATPGNVWRAEVMKAVSHHGYVAARTGQGTAIILANGQRPFGFRAQFRPTVTDTMWNGLLAHDQLQPRNMVWQSLDYSSETIVGAKADSAGGARLDTVYNNMRRAMYYAKSRKAGAVNLFTHAHKGNLTYTFGINLDEIGTILRAVNDDGGWIARASEYARWIQTWATPVNTPPAYAQPDSFRFQAHERVWFRPDGIDGRWIRGLRDKTVAATFDDIAPSAPTGLLAYGQNRVVVLMWSHGGGEPVSIYRVYRYFDGGDTTMVGSNVVAYYIDSSAVNGSPHNYYVTAVDAAGNESVPSTSATATPGSIVYTGRPAYAALWYQNIASGTSLTAAQLDSLAAFDALVTWSYPFKTGAANEASMDNLLSNLRARNADQILLTYVIAITPSLDWADYAAGSPEKKAWTFMVDGGDSTGFGRNLAGYVAVSDRYPTLFANVSMPGLADTLASYWAAAFDATDSDGEYAGLFVDLSDTTLANHLCYAGACGSKMDFDQDAIAYSSDADEKAAFKQFHIDFFKALRREFGERNMPNRLLVANGNFGRKAPALQTAQDSTMTGLLDGVLVEGFNVFKPGRNAATTEWDKVRYQQQMLRRSQVSPPLMVFHAIADSSGQYMTEPLAAAFDGYAAAVNGKDSNGTNSIPRLPRRLPAPGTYSGYSFQAGAGDDPDTLTATYSNMTARLMLDRNLAAAAADTFAVWPYLVTRADGTILSRSAFWELPEEEGAPTLVVQIQSGGEGDRRNTLTWEITSGSLPSDFSHWRIYRDPCDGCTDFIYDDNPTVYYSAEFGQAYSWTDTAVTNGVEYEYQIVAVDHNGQASDPIASDPMTPNDSTAPGVPQNLVASGGTGYIDLDWSNVTAADLIGYEVSRSFEGGAFAVTDTVTISAHQDSTALEANEYAYRVRSLDDDDNRSAYSDTVTAAWYGDPDPPASPPPSNVMAWPDTPQGRTSVVVYAPADTTGLTGYQVFRGAAADTGSLALYKNNIAVGQFAGAVFEDNKANSDPDTTWYYTAKAMYGAARSEKFHTPRGALTTGNYPSMIPVTSVAGAGALSAIVVAWSQIAGSDSTEIYRGTTAGSQTRIATVAHAANPYYDTGAAANTDYYYKVRYKDNPGTYTAYSAVAGPARWTSVPSGDPSVSGVTGSVSHGSTITISGANFGTNSTANIYWDNVEGGSFAGFWTDSNGSPDGKIVASASGAGRRHAGSAYHAAADFGSGGGYGSLEYSGTSHTWFCQYWVKLDSNWNWGGAANTPLSNVKFWRMYQTTGNEDFVVALNTFNGSVIIVNENISGFQNTWYHWGNYATEFTENVWHCWQFEYRNSSAPGVADGVFRWWRNGTLAFERTNMVTMEDYSSARYPLIMGFYDSSGASGYDGANTVYFDDFYMSKGWARVEIGNASTYSACTHREIQIPSAWSATSITCTVNAGTLTGSGKYLFVINADGTASAGYPVTIE